MLRWLPKLFVALALACFAWAGYGYFTQDTGPSLVIPDAERELACMVGESQELTFELRNGGSHPVGVVGLVWC